MARNVERRGAEKQKQRGRRDGSADRVRRRNEIA